jgi:hypothetical protein
MPQDPLQVATNRTQNNNCVLSKLVHVIFCFFYKNLAAIRNRLAVQCICTGRRVYSTCTMYLNNVPVLAEMQVQQVKSNQQTANGMALLILF